MVPVGHSAALQAVWRCKTNNCCCGVNKWHLPLSRWRIILLVFIVFGLHCSLCNFVHFNYLVNQLSWLYFLFCGKSFSVHLILDFIHLVD